MSPPESLVNCKETTYLSDGNAASRSLLQLQPCDSGTLICMTCEGMIDIYLEAKPSVRVDIAFLSLKFCRDISSIFLVLTRETTRTRGRINEDESMIQVKNLDLYSYGWNRDTSELCHLHDVHAPKRGIVIWT